LYRIGEARRATEAYVSVIFASFAAHLHSDLKGLCLNVTADKQLLFAEHINFTLLSFTGDRICLLY
jgi:hypothetical protein